MIQRSQVLSHPVPKQEKTKATEKAAGEYGRKQVAPHAEQLDPEITSHR